MAIKNTAHTRASHVRCVRIDPRALASRDILANLWLSTGRSDRAEAMYLAMLSERSGDTLALAGAGRAAFASGNRRQGLVLLRKAAAQAPENTDVRRDLALALNATGDPGAGAEELEAAAKAHPARATEMLGPAQQLRSQAR